MIGTFERFSMTISDISKYCYKIAADEMKTLGLRGSFAIYLITLLRYPSGITAARLSELCGKDKSDVSRAMAELQKCGLVTKLSGENDYRALLVLTESGRESAERCRASARYIEKIAREDVPPEDMDTFLRVLAMIGKRLRAISEDGSAEAKNKFKNRTENTMMSSYKIFTDSACDIKPTILADWGVSFCSLTFRFDGTDTEYNDVDMDIGEFYRRMRAGEHAKTAAVNSQVFSDAFEAELKDGYDVLYLGFSSGLSTTYNSARIAAAALAEKYPERKIITVDTYAASAGFGLILKLTVDQQKNGASIEDAATFATETAKKMCHWFTVDDLVYLKRGGRISPTVAFVGNALGIKPILHMDDAGHLINMSKVRGRKNAVLALADKYGELAVQLESSDVFICHADCSSDAEELKRILKTRYNADVTLITDVGPVIGSHAGPGTLSVFFVGKER